MERTCIEIADYIPEGYNNRISRKNLVKRSGCDDRLARTLIAASDYPIVHADGGYFIPNKEDETDRRKAEIYVLQEKHRIKMLNKKLKKFKDYRWQA